MIFRPLLAAAAIFLAGCQVSPVSAEPQEAPQWRLAIHGGAGVITRGSMTPEQEALYRAGLQEALEAGADVLRNISIRAFLSCRFFGPVGSPS